MLNIKDRVFELWGKKYYVIKYLSGSLLAVEDIKREMFLIFQGPDDGNTFIPLPKGKQSLCPISIKNIFPEVYQKVDYLCNRIYLVGKDGEKYLLVYSENVVAEPGSKDQYNIETINIVDDDDELVFDHFGHRIISLGIKKVFTIKGEKII